MMLTIFCRILKSSSNSNIRFIISSILYNCIIILFNYLCSSPVSCESFYSPAADNFPGTESAVVNDTFGFGQSYSWQPFKYTKCLSSVASGTRDSKFEFDDQVKHQPTTMTTCNMEFKWNFNETHAWFRVRFNSKGYLRLAFNSNPDTLLGSDVILAWVDPTNNGSIHLRDNHVKDNKLRPDLDVEQNYVILNGYEIDGNENIHELGQAQTIISFIRKIDTCDPEDFKFTGDTMYIHWAYHPEDPINNGSFSFIGLVTGTTPINLFNHPGDSLKIESGSGVGAAQISENLKTTTFNLTMKVDFGAKYWSKNKINLSTPIMQYMCQLLKIPKLDTSSTTNSGENENRNKFHVIMRKLLMTPSTSIPMLSERDHNVNFHHGEKEAIINKSKDVPVPPIDEINLSGNLKPLIKHAVLYACSRDLNHLHSKYASFSGIYPCYQTSSGFPDVLFYCNDVITGFALGGDEEFYWPNEAGYSLGTEHDPEFVMLELLMDSSSTISVTLDNKNSETESPKNLVSLKKTYSLDVGFEFTYTDALRTFDSGVLATGPEPTDWYFLPPGIKDIVVTGHCSAECTAKDFPSDGIHVYATQFYSHGEISKISSIQVRAGREIGLTAENSNFQTDFQAARYNEIPINIKPGDHILTKCHYKRQQTSLGFDKSNITSTTDTYFSSNGRRGGRENTEKFETSGVFWYQRPCMQFLFYYPKVPRLTSCKSEPNPLEIYDIFRDPSLIQLSSRQNKEKNGIPNDVLHTNNNNNNYEDGSLRLNNKIKKDIRTDEGSVKNYEAAAPRLNFPPEFGEEDLIGNSIYDVHLNSETNEMGNPQLSFYAYLASYPWTKRFAVSQKLKELYEMGDYINLCRDVNRSPITASIEKRNSYPLIYQSLPSESEINNNKCPAAATVAKYPNEEIFHLIEHGIATHFQNNEEIESRRLRLLDKNGGELSSRPGDTTKQFMTQTNRILTTKGTGEEARNNNENSTRLGDLNATADNSKVKDYSSYGGKANDKIFRIQVIEYENNGPSAFTISTLHHTTTAVKTFNNDDEELKDNFVAYKDVEYIYPDYHQTKNTEADDPHEVLTKVSGGHDNQQGILDDWTNNNRVNNKHQKFEQNIRNKFRNKEHRQFTTTNQKSNAKSTKPNKFFVFLPQLLLKIMATLILLNVVL